MSETPRQELRRLIMEMTDAQLARFLTLASLHPPKAPSDEGAGAQRLRERQQSKFESSVIIET